MSVPAAVLGVLCLILAAACGTMGYVIVRMAKKLFQFDDLFDLLQDEIATNVSFFEKLLKTPLFMASPEIEQANANMNLMRIRLQEYAAQMAELTGKSPEPQEPPLPRPKVV